VFTSSETQPDPEAHLTLGTAAVPVISAKPLRLRMLPSALRCRFDT
jgi:hypothetical protein